MRRDTILSVVIPTLDEAERLPALLSDLRPLGAEVLVVDGGSVDATRQLGRDLGARVVEAPPGRGLQLRAGADLASGDWLFFVHADSRLDAPAIAALSGFLDEAEPTDFAHFRFELEQDRAIDRFIEFGQRLREGWLGLVYGDQGLVVSRPMYDLASGYPEWPLMEDVGIVQRLSERGRRVALPAAIVTSSRRYDEEGGLRRWMRNVMLMSAFRAGVHPDRLTRWYRTRRSAAATTTSARRLVGVFAKPPIPGRVKTRLAADIGEARATEIYRVLGRRTVDALRDGEFEVLVFVDAQRARDPSQHSILDSTNAVKEWLGEPGIDFRTQIDGDLGARMHAALGECLAAADAACLVGTDLPDLRAATVEAAFSALSRAEVVIGPATDGGYYLIGMTAPHRELFVEIPWSTDEVLDLTLERAAALGLRVELLAPKTDVDTAADLPADLAVGAPPPRHDTCSHTCDIPRG